MNANELVTKRLQIKAESKLEVEQQLHEWNALLQNALRAPVDHRLVREILWAMADLEGYALRLEIKAGMREGKKIRICDMTESHLVNTINMLVRCAEKARSRIPYPSFQGEMAQYYAEGEWWRMQEENPWDLAEEMYELFSHLVNEAERRKIKLSYE